MTRHPRKSSLPACARSQSGSLGARACTVRCTCESGVWTAHHRQDQRTARHQPVRRRAHVWVVCMNQIPSALVAEESFRNSCARVPRLNGVLERLFRLTGLSGCMWAQHCGNTERNGYCNSLKHSSLPLSNRTPQLARNLLGPEGPDHDFRRARTQHFGKPLDV